MGTRDIYIALTVAILFTVIMDVLFNEDSNYCILPVSFTEYHTQISEEQQDNDITQNIPGMPPTQNNNNNNNSSATKPDSSSNTDSLIGEEEVKKATEVLKRAKEQNTFKERDDFYSNYYTSQM